MHVAKKARRITGTGTKDKTAVMGILERGGRVRTTVVPNRRKSALQAEVRKHVEAGSALYTDTLLSYEGLAKGDLSPQLPPPQNEHAKDQQEPVEGRFTDFFAANVKTDCQDL